MVVMILPSCKNRVSGGDEPDSRINEYVAGYTSGQISRDEDIIIKFARPAVAPEKIGSVAGTKIISVSPAISGSAVWTDNSTLVFTPEEEMEWDRVYEFEVMLEPLFGKDVAVKSFRFRVSTIAKNFKVEILGLSAAEEGAGDYYIEGSVFTSGRFDNEESESIITASQEGRQLAIDWEHDGETNYHVFFVRGIARGEDASTVDISWNGKRAGVNNSGSKSIDVPSKKEFKLTSWRVVTSPSQYLAIEFSDELNENMELNGLLFIDNNPVTRVSRSANTLHLFTASRLSGTHKVRVDGSLSNRFGYKLGEDVSFDADFGGVKPAVRFTGSGVRVP